MVQAGHAEPNRSCVARDRLRDDHLFHSFPVLSRFVPTDDRPLGHVAFSVTDLTRMRARVAELGIEIVHEPAVAEEGFRSFFVRAPEKVLVEFVEAGPLESP